MPVKRSGIQKKASLKSNVSLKRNLSSKKPRVKLEDRTASQLVKFADSAFSKYVRLRDSEFVDSKFVAKCIDCPKVKIVYQDGKWAKGIDNGHYISRGVMSLRYDEMNCNAQESHCNAWRDKGDVERDYSLALDKKYGKGTAKELKALSKLEGAYKIPPKSELLDIIYTCRAYVKRTLEEQYGKS